MVLSAISKIEEEQGSYAKQIASRLNAPINRKKGMIDLLGVTLFAKFLKKRQINLNLNNCLHKFPFALEEYKITDISYNGYKIFIITVFNENYIRIPKLHFQLGIQPDFYVITEVNKSVEKGAIGGYIKASDVTSLLNDDRFYYPEKRDISKIDGLIEKITIPNRPRSTYGKHLDACAKFVKLVDNELTKSEKDKLIKHLLTCESCIAKLRDFMQFDNAMSPAKSFSEAIQDVHPSKIDKRKGAESTVVPIRRNLAPRFTQIQIEQSKEDAELENTFDFLKKKFANKKEAIDLMFKNKNVFDIDFSKINIKDFKQKKKTLIIAGAVLVILVSFLIGAGVKKSIQAPKPIDGYEDLAYENGNTDPGFYDDKYSQEYFEAQNLDYTLASATNGRSSVSGVKNISWEVDSDIAGKENYTKFLQIVGKNIKLSLQNELLLTPDFARNNIIKADIKFSNNGNVGSMKLIKGSGSPEIDDIIQKCVYETLSYIKPPKAGLMEKNLEMTLIIEL